MTTKIDINFIRRELETFGYTLLSTVYKNAHTKLNFRCSKAHIHYITWASWSQGHRCKFCAVEEGSRKRRNDFSNVKKAFESEGYVLLSNDYIGSHSKLDYLCPNNHKHSISWTNWQQGQRCSKCSGVSRLDLDYVKASFEREGYCIVSNSYKNAIVKLNYTCVRGHKGTMSWCSWQKGCRCPECNNLNMSLRQMGYKNHNWKGGISFEPYCEAWKDKEYKEDIKERDGFKCLNPCCDSKNSNDLTIHHIDYNKKNCRPENLVTICRSCNTKANTDRAWHKAWYLAVLKNRYGG